MAFCLAGLAAILVIVGWAFCGEMIKEALRRLHGWKFLVLLVMAGFCTWAAQKRIVRYPAYPVSEYEYANYLIDNGSYVDSESNEVYINFLRVVVPDTAMMYVDRRQNGEGNEWETFYQSSFGDMKERGCPPLTLIVDNATNYQWQVYTDWTPGASVKTNGVWHTYWATPTNQPPPTLNLQFFLPMKTVTRLSDTNGIEVISTPDLVREGEYEYYDD